MTQKAGILNSQKYGNRSQCFEKSYYYFKINVHTKSHLSHSHIVYKGSNMAMVNKEVKIWKSKVFFFLLSPVLYGDQGIDIELFQLGVSKNPQLSFVRS